MSKYKVIHHKIYCFAQRERKRWLIIRRKEALVVLFITVLRFQLQFQSVRSDRKTIIFSSEATTKIFNRQEKASGDNTRKYFSIYVTACVTLCC